MFVKEIYKRSKWLFALVTTFCVLQAFFIYKGVETVPFFNYGMYSEPVSNNLQEVFVIKLDNQTFNYHQLPSLQKDMLLTPLTHYYRLEQTDFSDPILPAIEKRFKKRVSEKLYSTITARLSNDKTTREAFQTWFKKYLKSATQKNFQQLEVSVIQTNFLENPKNDPITNKVLFKI